MSRKYGNFAIFKKSTDTLSALYGVIKICKLQIKLKGKYRFLTVFKNSAEFLEKLQTILILVRTF